MQPLILIVLSRLDRGVLTRLDRGVQSATEMLLFKGGAVLHIALIVPSHLSDMHLADALVINYHFV